jgi:hypothetical protein
MLVLQPTEKSGEEETVLEMRGSWGSMKRDKVTRLPNYIKNFQKW